MHPTTSHLQPLTEDYLSNIDDDDDKRVTSVDYDYVSKKLADVPDQIRRLKSFKLIRAAHSGSGSAVQRLIAQHASPNFVAVIEKNCSISSILAACDQGHPTVVQQLLAAKANVNAACRYGGCFDDEKDNGRTALEHACSRGDLECVKVLLSHGADASRVHTCSLGNMDTPLTLALEYPRHLAKFAKRREIDYDERVTTIVRLLLEAKASPTAQQFMIGGPLDYALSMGYWDAAELILEVGTVDPRAPNRFGHSALDALSGVYIEGSDAPRYEQVIRLARSLIRRKPHPSKQTWGSRRRYIRRAILATSSYCSFPHVLQQ